MRLVFISSVTAMTPLRMISVMTGSALRRFFDVLFDALAIFVLKCGISYSALSPCGRGQPQQRSNGNRVRGIVARNRTPHPFLHMEEPSSLLPQGERAQ